MKSRFLHQVDQMFLYRFSGPFHDSRDTGDLNRRSGILHTDLRGQTCEVQRMAMTQWLSNSMFSIIKSYQIYKINLARLKCLCWLNWNVCASVSLCFPFFCLLLLNKFFRSSPNPIRSSTPKSRLSMRQMWPLGPMNRGTISGAIGMKSWATQKLHKTWQNRSFVAFFLCHNSKEITDVTTMSQSFMWKTSMLHIKKHIMQGIIFQLLWMTSISWMIANQDLFTSWRKEDKRSTSSWISS